MQMRGDERPTFQTPTDGQTSSFITWPICFQSYVRFLLRLIKLSFIVWWFAVSRPQPIGAWRTCMAHIIGLLSSSPGPSDHTLIDFPTQPFATPLWSTAGTIHIFLRRCTPTIRPVSPWIDPCRRYKPKMISRCAGRRQSAPASERSVSADPRDLKSPAAPPPADGSSVLDLTDDALEVVLSMITDARSLSAASCCCSRVATLCTPDMWRALLAAHLRRSHWLVGDERFSLAPTLSKADAARLLLCERTPPWRIPRASAVPSRPTAASLSQVHHTSAASASASVAAAAAAWAHSGFAGLAAMGEPAMLLGSALAAAPPHLHPPMQSLPAPYLHAGGAPHAPSPPPPPPPPHNLPPPQPQQQTLQSQPLPLPLHLQPPSQVNSLVPR